MDDPTPTTLQRCGRCRTEKAIDQFSPSYRGKPGTWCRPCFAAYHRGEIVEQPAIPTRQCKHCGADYTPKQVRRTMFCSPECKSAAKWVVIATRRDAAKPDRFCVWCGGLMPRTMRSDARFCSRDCMGMGHKQIRNVRRRSGSAFPSVSLFSIADRDGFKCQICGEDVDMTLKHPDPKCASLDHVVSLASGGTHDASNLQLSHLRCNISKGVRPHVAM